MAKLTSNFQTSFNEQIKYQLIIYNKHNTKVKSGNLQYFTSKGLFSNK